MSVVTETISANLRRVGECIARAAYRANRDPAEVTLVAVSKTQPADAIRAAYEAGVRHFGENRVQEWETKRPLLEDLPATWHLIGHLQSNKVPRAVRLFSRVDSVDSIALATRIDRCAVGNNAAVPILIEVRMDPAPTKEGVSPENIHEIADAILSLPRLQLLGLMCVPPQFAEADQVRPYFRGLRQLRDTLVRHYGIALPELSMGMSHDFEIAIEEGATHVRIGTAIFGRRPPA
jgi:hypothetical protein